MKLFVKKGKTTATKLKNHLEAAVEEYSPMEKKEDL